MHGDRLRWEDSGLSCRSRFCSRGIWDVLSWRWLEDIHILKPIEPHILYFSDLYLFPFVVTTFSFLSHISFENQNLCILKLEHIRLSWLKNGIESVKCNGVNLPAKVRGLIPFSVFTMSFATNT